MHPVEGLCQLLDQIGPYPTGILPIPQRITGTAFFPGGWGLWGTLADKPLPAMPMGGVMVLGHDFHSEQGYKAALHRNGEDLETNPTWRGLLSLLKRANINVRDCFFTNLFPGVRKGNKSMGPFPGLSDRTFVQKCRNFFMEQLRAQRPRHILVLGMNVPPIIAELSPDLTSWQGARSFSALDASESGPTCLARFDDGRGLRISTTVVALTHPCLRSSNIHRRRYAGLSGDEAELRMLSDLSRVKRALD
jgi:hypothetical protein